MPGKFRRKIRRIPCLSESKCNGGLTLITIQHKLKSKGKMVTVPDVEVWRCDTCAERFYPFHSSEKISLYKNYSGRLMLRLNPEIHHRVTRLAQKHHRSLNQEIRYLLETALPGPRTVPGVEI